MMKKIFVFVQKNDPVKLIVLHVFGEEHTAKHKIIVGLAVAFSGFSLAEMGSGFIHYINSFIGFGIHGIGFIPLVEEYLKHKLDK